MILVITPITAAALAALYVQLALAVIHIRHRDKVSLGNTGNDQLEKAVRAHANLTEWAPIGLILIAILEFNAAPAWICAPPAIVFVAGRTLHPKGLQSNDKKTLSRRALAMRLTAYAVIALAVLNVLWMGYRLVFS